jgi:hypothetical protein
MTYSTKLYTTQKQHYVMFCLYFCHLPWLYRLSSHHNAIKLGGKHSFTSSSQVQKNNLNANFTSTKSSCFTIYEVEILLCCPGLSCIPGSKWSFCLNLLSSWDYRYALSCLAKFICWWYLNVGQIPLIHTFPYSIAQEKVSCSQTRNRK